LRSIQVGGTEHVRVFEQLVFTLGHGTEDDLALLAEIEQRRAHEIANVLDHQQAVPLRHQTAQSCADHLGVERLCPPIRSF
jgi:hypothetical protein